MGGLRRTFVAGRGRALLCATALALLALAPNASAGADVHAGPASVLMVDEHGTECGLAGVCLVTLADDRPLGETTLDAHLDIRYVGVALDLPGGTTRVGAFDLLPGGGLVLDGDQLYVSHPVTRIATEAIQNWTSPAPGVFNPTPTKHNFSFTYLRPDPAHPGLLRPAYWSLKWSEGGIDYDKVGPMDTPIGSPTTDGWVDSFVTRYPCQYAPGRTGCGPAQTVNSTWTNATPNVVLGVSIGRAHVATDPALLAYGAARSPGDDGDIVPLHRPRHEAPTLERTGPTSEPVGRSPLAGPIDPAVLPAATPPEARETGAVGTLTQQPMTPEAVHVWVLMAAGAAAVALVATALGLALYSRISSKPQALKHPMRALIVDLVVNTPAISPTELAPMVGLTRNAVVHHVRILQRAGVLRVEQREGRTFLFAAHAAPASPGAPEVLCRLVGDDPLLGVLLDAPDGLTRSEIHERLADLPKRTRNHRLQRLQERGLLHVEGSGRRTRFVLQPDVREHLIQSARSRS